jgi:hypothetical protein
MRLRRRSAKPGLVPLKLRMLDVAFERLGTRSLADLGAIWAVDGGYSLYASDRHGAERVVIVDEDLSDLVREEARRRRGRVELIEANFGDPAVVETVGSVDAIACFDVLLHQVRPDWDEILAMWAPSTDRFVLAGPWWNGGRTERLLDLGEREYLASVPEIEFHSKALAHLDEINPERGRPWRDVHDIWQWGITELDLRERMASLGFVCAHAENLGRWRGLERFDDCGFVFCRPEILRGGSERP